MSEENAYYQSLIQQGYDVNQATVYTQEHFPSFVGPSAAPTAPAAPAAPESDKGMDPNMMAMMMMNQQNQQAMIQQQTMLAQSQQGNSGGQTIVIQQNMYQGKSLSTGYLMWCLCLIGICGGQRFYYGRIGSGIIYLFTFGFFGFGQLYDLLIMNELAKTA